MTTNEKFTSFQLLPMLISSAPQISKGDDNIEIENLSTETLESLLKQAEAEQGQSGSGQSAATIVKTTTKRRPKGQLRRGSSGALNLGEVLVPVHVLLNTLGLTVTGNKLLGIVDNRPAFESKNPSVYPSRG